MSAEVFDLRAHLHRVSWSAAMREQQDQLNSNLSDGTSGDQLLRIVALNQLLQRYSVDELVRFVAQREDD